MDITSIGSLNTYNNFSSEIATNKDKDFQAILENSMKSKDKEELKKACDEFESYFINSMFKAMRKTINYSDGVIKKGQAETIFQEMLDEETSTKLTSSGGIGLSDMMFRQMSKVE